MGSNFSHGRFPPMPNGNGGGTPITVAAPQNDFQLVCQMAALLLAQEPVLDDVEKRNAQADIAASRAVELFGHVAYKFGRGIIETTARMAVNAGQEALKEAVLNEESKGQSPPPDGDSKSKIITDIVK